MYDGRSLARPSPPSDDNDQDAGRPSRLGRTAYRRGADSPNGTALRSDGRGGGVCGGRGRRCRGVSRPTEDCGSADR